MKSLGFTILISCILFACKKSVSAGNEPNAKFVIGSFDANGNIASYTDSSNLVIGTHENYHLINQSTYTDSIRWDLGNGTTSSIEDPLFPTDTPGTYKVTLTAYGQGGAEKRTVSKNITVLERALKSISINNLQLNNFASNRGFPIFVKANLWVEIKYSQKQDPLTLNGDISAPAIYKSPVFTHIDSSFHSSLTFALPETEEVIINYPVKNLTVYPASGKGTIVNLYAQDNSGTYLVASSFWYATGGLQYFDGNLSPAVSNNYTVGFNVLGSTNAIRLKLAYQL